MRRRVRLTLRRTGLGLALAVAVLVGGCVDGAESDRAATEAVFLATCASGGTPIEEQVCRCAFEAVTDDLSDAELERLDRNLRDDPDNLPPEVAEAALDCAAAPLTPSPPPEETTTTTGGRRETTSTTSRSTASSTSTTASSTSTTTTPPRRTTTTASR